MASPITQKITVDTKEGIQNTKDLTSALEGSESAGKQVALALKQAADHIEADMKGTATAADALGQALGPEMAAKIGQSGLMDMVSDLKKLGLTSDDIVTDVDQLAASIQHLDAVGAGVTGPQKGLKDVGDEADKTKDKVHGLSGESDNSRSVMANMAGNSAQDIANIGGAAGTAGLALGQMAEYAADGNISLHGLATVVGPMAALTVGTLALMQGAKQAAAAEKELTDNIGKLSTATDKQVLAGLTHMMLDQFLAGHDLADVWTKIAETNIEGAKRLLALGQAQGWTAEQSKGLSDAIAVQDEATRQAAATTELYGTKVDAAGTSNSETEIEARRLNRTVETGTDTFKAAKSEIEKTTHVVDTFKESVADVNQKYDELTGRLDEQDAWENVVTKIGEAGDAAALTGQAARDLTRDIADYVTKTDTIPESKKTEILASLADGDIAKAEQQLADLTRTREIYLKLTGPGAVTAAGYDDDSKPHKAIGGPVSKGVAYTVGERGQETFVPNSDGTIVPTGPGGGPPPVHITLVMPLIASPADYYRAGQIIVAAQAEYERRRGY